MGILTIPFLHSLVLELVRAWPDVAASIEKARSNAAVQVVRWLLVQPDSKETQLDLESVHVGFSIQDVVAV